MKNIINRIKNDKVLFFLSILIIGVFLVLVIRITYSYLAAFINEARENVTIGSDTTDKLEFFEGNPIDLNVTSTTLPEGGGNYAQSTTYRAEFTANSTTNRAEDSYYVYFNVTANTLNYTQEGNPEVILTVFQDDTEITNIDGLTYGTYNGVTGFDVTEATGLFTVASDYAITSNSSTTPTVQNWTFTLTYLNQSYDQSGNYGNKMSVEFIMSKEEKATTTLAEYIISQYTGTDGENDLYYHDADLANGASDNSYRYAGANPNNYVCFGSTAATCPTDNLYRIIGVFGNEVKLIKSTSYGSYKWDSGGSNTWNSSTKPDIRSTLNTTFLGTLSSTWQNKIATHSWEVGGMARDNSATARDYYDTEIRNQTADPDSMKIGLMYVSDFGFAASNSYWTTELFNYEPAKSSNWLAGLTEWTISRNLGGSGSAFYVVSAGYVDYLSHGVTTSNAVRPSFYLTSSTTYTSGSGSAADPIVIN